MKEGKETESREKTSYRSRGFRVISMRKRERKVKIQPPHIVVLLCKEKPQMPEVKQRLDPFFGWELPG